MRFKRQEVKGIGAEVEPVDGLANTLYMVQYSHKVAKTLSARLGHQTEWDLLWKRLIVRTGLSRTIYMRDIQKARQGHSRFQNDLLWPLKIKLTQ